MKILPLCNNHKTNNKCSTGNELSLLIYYKKTKILFDCGKKNNALINAEKLNEKLDDISHIVISHGHNDHMEGIKYLFQILENKNINLIAHPAIFRKRGLFLFNKLLLKLNHTCSKYDLKSRFNCIFTEKPYKLTENIFFLGYIHRETEQKFRYKYQYDNNILTDDISDDSALVYNTKKGLVIITGCAHSGLINILNNAIKVTDNNNIYALIGGFHLKALSKTKLKILLDELDKFNISKIYPLHCSGNKINKLLNTKKSGIGTVIEI